MVVIDNNTLKVYECNRKNAATLMQVTERTLYEWEFVKRYRKHKKGHRTIIFNSVIRFKQKKGFALTKNKKYINRANIS